MFNGRNLPAGKKLIKIGAEFNAEARTLSRWLVVSENQK